MKVFISYAKEQKELAQNIELALTGAGITTFFDQHDLTPSDEFYTTIRTAIRKSDLFLFIASREALAQNAYTLTELNIAQKKWPHPVHHVITLVADATPIASLPPYLGAVTVLVPAGNLIAEVVDAILTVREKLRRQFLLRLLGLSLILLTVFTFTIGTGFIHVPLINQASEDIDFNDTNNHVFRLKNEHSIRLVGKLLKNESNVADNIIKKYIEWEAWRYNRCYDAYFGQLPDQLPEGSIQIGFEIIDQLPRHAFVAHSDFTDAKFSKCVEDTLIDQTLNAAGPNGAGKVLYQFKFLPNSS